MMLPVHLRMARAALGWTLKDLERKASVSKNTISKYETGGQIMSDAVQRIEEVLRDAGVLLLDVEGDLGPGVRLVSYRKGEIPYSPSDRKQKERFSSVLSARKKLRN